MSAAAEDDIGPGEWIAGQARPADDRATLARIVGDAAVVGLGVSTHGAHQLTTLAAAMLEVLVAELGFRTLAVEATPLGGARVDHHLHTGEGDARNALVELHPHHRTEEMAGVVRWLRDWNDRHPAEAVRFAGIDLEAGEQVSGDVIAHVEPRLAGNIVDLHDRSGSRIAYWGGFSHTAVGDARVVSYPGTRAVHRNAGSHLRRHFGAGYVSIGLTFGQGTADAGTGPVAVPPPADGFAEAVLDAVPAAVPDPYLVGWREGREGRGGLPPAVRAWLEAPATLRLVGPWYDPAHDADVHMTGGALADWFAALAHVHRVTPVAGLG
jgi:erythromycin esterase